MPEYRRWFLHGGTFFFTIVTEGRQPILYTAQGRRCLCAGIEETQRRFWEHCIRDEEDWRRHVDYIHHNPVKHGLATCPHAWPWSTFKRWVARGFYETDWCCQCDGRVVASPTFEGVDITAPYYSIR